jgi:hypothetical protein
MYPPRKVLLSPGVRPKIELSLNQQKKTASFRAFHWGTSRTRHQKDAGFLENKRGIVGTSVADIK